MMLNALVLTFASGTQCETLLNRAAPDLFFSNPAGAGFAGFGMTNPAFKLTVILLI